MNVQNILEANADLFSGDEEVVQLLVEFTGRYPQLIESVTEIVAVYRSLITCFEQERTLYICGNGGSFADTLHISSELMKAFKKKRPVSDEIRNLLGRQPFGDELTQALETGFRVQPLGLNMSLNTALDNDLATRHMTFAQELFVFSRKKDLLLAISTSGNARNVALALSVAKAKGLTTIGLTGRKGGHLADVADLLIRVPEDETFKIQEYHLAIYHLLCSMVEAHWFDEDK